MFGQSTSTTPFGQNTANPFAPKPFGTPTANPFASHPPTFGASSSPAFGTATPAVAGGPSPFGNSNPFPFGGTSQQTQLTFGSSPTGSTTSFDAFGSTTNQSNPFGSSSQQTRPTFGSSPFGFATSFAASGSPFGSTASFAFGTTTSQSNPFGGSFQQKQSTPFGASSQPAVAAFDTVRSGTGRSPYALSFDAKSHQELRYRRRDKGDPNLATTQTNPTAISFSPSTSAAPVFISPFGTSSNPFRPSSTTSPLGAPSLTTGTIAHFSSTPAPLGAASLATATPTFITVQASPVEKTTSGFSILGTSSNPFRPSSTTSLLGAPSLPSGTIEHFGSTPAPLEAASFATATPTFTTVQASPVEKTTSGFSILGAQSTGLGSTSSSLVAPSSAPIASSQTTQAASDLKKIPVQSTATGQSMATVRPTPNLTINPFGTLPAMPQMSLGRPSDSSSYQHGISSIPVSEKPIPTRVSSLLLTPRQLSQRRIKLLPSRKFTEDSANVAAFFHDEEKALTTPKADALFVPRENPRALIIRPAKQSSSSRNLNVKKPYTLVDENGSNRTTQETGGILDDHPDGGVSVVNEHGADSEVITLMPKLKHPEYYTEPPIPELAAKERAEPGSSRRVKDFVVGRHRYGRIKFEGETDVRRLDLESIIEFNYREVIIYKDESKKPPAGQGLNKPAKITLLNVECVDKKTGFRYTEGAKVENYRELLKKKGEEQGAKFESYDPLRGEWKFKVDHF